MLKFLDRKFDDYVRKNIKVVSDVDRLAEELPAIIWWIDLFVLLPIAVVVIFIIHNLDMAQASLLQWSIDGSFAPVEYILYMAFASFILMTINTTIMNTIVLPHFWCRYRNLIFTEFVMFIPESIYDHDNVDIIKTQIQEELGGNPDEDIPEQED